MNMIQKSIFIAITLMLGVAVWFGFWVLSWFIADLIITAIIPEIGLKSCFWIGSLFYLLHKLKI